MKNSLSSTFLLTMSLCVSIFVTAQDSVRTVSVSPLEAARVEPYQVQVTYNKTTHLLFPSSIRYVDLGSDLLAASKGESVSNVLRIKSAVKHFDEETNFSVITEDGKFYSFNVMYSPYPDILNYDMIQLQRAQEKIAFADVTFEDLNGSSSNLTEAVLKNLYSRKARTIRHIGSKSYGILFSLKGLYVHDSKFYFVIDIRNDSQLSYEIDYISFIIRDKKNLKRTVSQDKVINPLRIYHQMANIEHRSKQQSVFLLDQFTLLENQVLEIEVFEKNGGRHQKFELDNDNLVHAMVVDQLHLKLD
ncbi:MULTISPECIES: conjugative transposon protein TraN [Chryseobacterium]|uniref:conjugative transposon protein TraN n=1 Tax=Chryseobacterium TaxID=59732 RepID=UPI001623EE3A|nr:MULTISPECIES: conjugative transposon protein TraN [Chryseobacterium]MBF6643945.1 conjugative transposon protein TraN [Chryseobacterium indologenes]MBU3046811.1 conjugative transposon protein TraN [Chryseobacterium indologenes]QQQ72328.1 conjugative transposon protein TraN [Chryseobacterium indologenes]